MAKPRVFVSSTYYDLKHIRDRLEAFIESIGYEPVLFESGDIVFNPDLTLDHSCYEEMTRCHILVLIIGGRYGSPASGDTRPSGTDLEKMYKNYNSVTKSEYERARSQGIPIYIFVEKGVMAEYELFKRNRTNKSIQYAHVDSVNIFALLDDILAQNRNNFVRPFERFDDIAVWLKEQWAGLLHTLLAHRSNNRVLEDLSTQLAGLKDVSATLKSYAESIIRKVDPKESEQVISDAEEKLQNEKLRRFSESDDWAFIKRGTSLTAKEVFEVLRKAKNAGEFFEAIGLPEYDDEHEVWISEVDQGTGHIGVNSDAFVKLRKEFVE